MASFSAHSTLGAVQIGFSVSCVVFGVLLGQAYAYFKNFPVDRRVYKVLVGRSFSPFVGMNFLSGNAGYITFVNRLVSLASKGDAHPLIV